MSAANLKLVKTEISDEVLAELALALEEEANNTLDDLADAVLRKDYRAAELIAKEVKRRGN